MSEADIIPDYITERRKADRRSGDIYVDACGFVSGMIFILAVQALAWISWLVLDILTSS